MTRDDIIRMAREAGYGESMSDLHAPALERFAALVAAYVRENEFKPDWNNYRQGLVDGAAAEREACALVCEAEAEKWEGDDGPISTEARLCAINIRARGNK